MKGLLEICEEEQVFVSYQSLAPDEGLLALFVRDHQGRPVIILDETLPTQPRIERCVLAEEVGHYKTTGAGSIIIANFNYNSIVTMSKIETAALRWAVDHYLMPTPDFAEAVRKGRRDPKELAEYFYVTLWVVWRKIHFLRQDVLNAFGLRISAKEVFSPLLVREMWGWNEAEHVFF